MEEVRGIVPINKTKGVIGLTKVPDGLLEDRPQFDPAAYFKVIRRTESSILDGNVNDRIQREGCDANPVGSKKLTESVWGGKESGNIHEVNWFRNRKEK